MKQCSRCGTANREGILFCDECGRPLQRTDTAALRTNLLNLETSSLYARSSWGTAQFEQDSVIVLHIRNVVEPIVLQPKERLVMGRSDSHLSSTLDVDFSPYGALDNGVSRTHAAIVQNEETLTLVDLGSSNGTHLNGQRLLPDQPRILRDGDEIRFGRLVTHIYFKSS